MKRWKQGLYCWYFGLNLKFLQWPYRKYIKTAKTLLAVRIFFFVFIFCSYCCSATASEAVVKITTDENDYENWFLAIIVWIATAYQ